ncbi:MAG: hypothetical protein A2X47_06195 [Lentisphaerae bacterium GWF2_38_69]|nr:MAG: hypothetical protein A2X47_06195 [Lentisphaerae bacterium GWF2_38_69]
MEEFIAYLKIISSNQSSSRKVRLVAEELLTNIIKYGYADSTEKLIDFTLHPNKKSFRIVIVDDAKPFNPTIAREKPNADSAEGLKIGGLGLIIVKKSCSRMNYRRDGNKNKLSITVPI